jgi:hypothetical protein
MIRENEAREIINRLEIESSYSKNGLGIFLYETVLEISPLKIVEFGTLFGYSAICMGLALKTLGNGSLTCFDLWEDYSYKSSKRSDVQQRIDDLGVSDFVTLEKGNIFEGDWSNLNFDFCHIDVSNDGEKIYQIHEIFKEKIKSGIPVIFEGGTPERDNVEWMTKYKRASICSTRDKLNYTVINEKFPGISIFSDCISSDFIDKIKKENK